MRKEQLEIEALHLSRQNDNMENEIRRLRENVDAMRIYAGVVYKLRKKKLDEAEPITGAEIHAIEVGYRDLQVITLVTGPFDKLDRDKIDLLVEDLCG